MTTDRRMRLLLVAQPLVAGVPRHVVDLLPAVVDAGWEVTIACPKTSVLWDEAARLGLRRRAISPRRSPGPRDLWDLVRLLPLIRRCEVTHVHSSKSGFVVRLGAVLAGRRSRCVFTPHGWSWWAFTGRSAAFYLALERAAARWCGRIIAVSAYERDDALARGVGTTAQYRVVPNGVDETRFDRPHRPQPDRMVMVARLAPPRLPAVAVRAMALVLRQRPTASLDFVGDGPLRDEVEAAAKELGIEHAVTLLGERADVADQLAGAACLVHLSRYEGASLAVLEGMAAGCPVVASRLGGMDELVDEGVTGYLVGDDPADVATAVLRVLAADDGGLRLGEAGRRRVVERYTSSGMAAATLRVYAECMKAQPAT